MYNEGCDYTVSLLSHISLNRTHFSLFSLGFDEMIALSEGITHFI